MYRYITATPTTAVNTGNDTFTESQIHLYICEKPVIRWCMWANEWPKSTPLKRAQHISRISFIRVASYTSPVRGERKNSARHRMVNYEAAKFSQPPQWCPIIFQTQKVTWWRVTGRLMYGYKFFMLLHVFSKEYTRQSVSKPIQPVNNNDE